MLSGWSESYGWIRRIEAGFVNHPSDPGGATFAGITVPAVVGIDRDKDGKLDFDLDGDGDVDSDDIALLKEHGEKVEAFYGGLWEFCGAARLVWPWSLLLFDAAVHHGPRPAALLVQRALRVTADGSVGPKTALAAAQAPPVREIDYLILRSRLMADICVRRGFTFYNGWMKRLFELQRVAEAGVALQDAGSMGKP